MPTYPNSIVRTLGDKLGEQPSVLDYGPAAIADGTTDATAAIQAGLNSVAARGGGALLLTDGVFSVLDLTIPEGVVLVGRGSTSVLKRRGTIDTGLGVVNIQGVSRVGLKNLVIDGDTPNPTGLTYNMFGSNPMDPNMTRNTSVWIHGGSSNVVLEDVEIRHTGGYAVLADSAGGSIKGIHITRCLFHNNRPHLFGLTEGDTNYGAWTGGVLFRGDCTEEAPGAIQDVHVSQCVWRRNAGNCLWMHCLAFASHHQNFHFVDNLFEDCGLDGILLGNLQGGVVSGNVLHRVGYMCLDDTSPSTINLPSYTVAVGIDSSGYVADVTITGNTLTSVVGGFIDGDGLRDCVISNNRCVVPKAGTVEYELDQIASYRPEFPSGVNLGNTQLNGGGANVLIQGNAFVGCPGGAVRLNFGRGCAVLGNHIEHPDSPWAPIQIYALTAYGEESAARDNVVAGNHIQYSGQRFLVEELGDDAAYVGASNQVFNNYHIGVAKGELLRKPSSTSWSGLYISSNDPNLTARNAVQITRYGQGTSGALQFFLHEGNVRTFLGQLGDVGPTLNISEATGTASPSGGRVCTGPRTDAAGMTDLMFTGKLIGDSFLMLGDTTYNAAEPNLFDGSWGMLRYVAGSSTTSGTFLVSTRVDAGTRVWEPLGGGASTPPGADTQVIFNDAGAFGATTQFTYSKTPNTLQLRALSGQSTNLFQAVDNAGTLQAALTQGYAWLGSGFGGTGTTPAFWLGPDTLSYTDVRLRRGGVGILEIDNGTPSAYRDLRLRYLAAFGDASNTIQAPNGGVTALSLISTRNDGFPGIVLSRTSSVARNWGLQITGAGQLEVYDMTASAPRLQFPTSGLVVVPGVASQASIYVTTGYIQSSEGFLTLGSSANAIQAPNGGFFGLRYKANQAFYPITYGTSATPPSPDSGYGGFSHRSGSTYWYWNGSAWASVNFAAVASVPGADTQVIFNDNGAFGASSKLTFNKTHAILVITSTSGVAGLYVGNGYVQSDGGFLSLGSNSNQVNIPNGGVTAMSLISERNDGFNGLTLNRSAWMARQWGFRIDSSGQLVVRDETAGSNRLTFSTSGGATFGGQLTFGGSSALVQGTITRIDAFGNFVGSFVYWNGSSYEYGLTDSINFSTFTGTAVFKGGILVGLT